MSAHRTALDLPLECYGHSVLQTPLRWLPPRALPCRLLVLAGIHGEEADTTILLSRALRSIDPQNLSGHIGIILCANPDGLSLGTRGNANGVDLNRNFPSSNWSSEPSSCRWHVEDGPVLPIGTGHAPASEPETDALIRLIQQWKPGQILSLHGPLACVDDPESSALGQWLSSETGLPLVRDIGYPTPGSMGSWAAEQNHPLITLEFPSQPIELLSRNLVPVLCRLLDGRHPLPV